LNGAENAPGEAGIMRLTILAVLLLSGWDLLGAADAAPLPGTDPDWPCMQLLVPQVSAGSYWDGPVAAKPNWRDDEALFGLVTEIVDRNTPEKDAVAKLEAYADAIPKADRDKALPALFGAIVDQTNDERERLIARIKELGLRQRRMGDRIADLGTEVDHLPAGDPHRADVTGERDLDIQAFQATQSTMRYACEVPGAMERRLGDFARVLQKKLKG
jgi:hypothetical protein